MKNEQDKDVKGENIKPDKHLKDVKPNDGGRDDTIERGIDTKKRLVAAATTPASSSPMGKNDASPAAPITNGISLREKLAIKHQPLCTIKGTPVDWRGRRIAAPMADDHPRCGATGQAPAASVAAAAAGPPLPTDAAPTSPGTSNPGQSDRPDADRAEGTDGGALATGSSNSGECSSSGGKSRSSGGESSSSSDVSWEAPSRSSAAAKRRREAADLAARTITTTTSWGQEVPELGFTVYYRNLFYFRHFYLLGDKGNPVFVHPRRRKGRPAPAVAATAAGGGGDKDSDDGLAFLEPGDAAHQPTAAKSPTWAPILLDGPTGEPPAAHGRPNPPAGGGAGGAPRGEGPPPAPAPPLEGQPGDPPVADGRPDRPAGGGAGGAAPRGEGPPPPPTAAPPDIKEEEGEGEEEEEDVDE